MLKISPALGLRLEHRDDLGSGLHKFGLVQHNSAAWKVLKARDNQHQVIAGGSAAPSLADADTLTAPYGVSLPVTLAMAQEAYVRLRVVLATLFRTDHPTALMMKEMNVEITERETDIE